MSNFGVLSFRKYRRLSRKKLAGACLVIAAREDNSSISVKYVALQIGSSPNEIGRLVLRISKDFKIKSYFPETKHIFVQFLSKYINSLADAILFEAILSMALDLYDFSCNLFSFRSLFPLIYGSLFLSLSFNLRNSAPDISSICLFFSQNKFTIQRSISLLKITTIQASSKLPIVLNRKNFITKIPDILKYKSAILYYSKVHTCGKEIPGILSQSDPSHPIHFIISNTNCSDEENLSNISDSEVENYILNIREVEQKLVFYELQPLTSISNSTNSPQ